MDRQGMNVDECRYGSEGAVLWFETRESRICRSMKGLR